MESNFITKKEGDKTKKTIKQKILLVADQIDLTCRSI